MYSVAEISRLLMELGGEWSKLSDNKSRHKEEISIDVNGKQATYVFLYYPKISMPADIFFNILGLKCLSIVVSFNNITTSLSFSETDGKSFIN